MGLVTMRFLISLACASFLAVTAAEAQTFAPDDVSILLAPPEGPGSPMLALPETSFSAATAEMVAKLVEQFGKVAGPSGPVAIDPALFRGQRGTLEVTSIRLDPGAPGLSAAFAPFGRSPQIRLVVQPVAMENGKAVVRDEAIHLVYTFGLHTGTDACFFHVTPDLAAFGPVVDDLLALKAALQAKGVDTDGAPLGVHPAFAQPATAALLVDGLDAFLRTHATEDRLDAVSVAGLPANAPEPWIFLAMSRNPEERTVKPVPGPAIAQGGAVPAFAQMLSFVGGSQVVPAGLTRNRLPVDCLANFLPGVTQPDGSDGVTTSTLFAANANTPEAAAAVAAVVADPRQAHFFNTDCLSCHTETRREIDASADKAAASVAIATAEGIEPAAMPRGPDDSARSFDQWNVRAFGWYPGFGPAGARAHATVVRRTARETAEVVACLNSGNWRDPALPCPGAVAAAPPAEPVPATPAAAPVPVGAPVGAPVGLPAVMDVLPEKQGWSDGIRERFYHTSQGSVLMPVAYFTALPGPDGQGSFAAPDNLSRYGLLPSEGDLVGLNPLGLPIGLALAGTGPTANVGLNCAACHTADVIANGQRIRVDGAPAAFDFDRFLADLARSVQATIQVDGPGPDARPTPAFAAFLERVAATAPTLASPSAALGFATEFLGQAALRHPAQPSGPGRVDALTQIVNALAVSDLGMPANYRVPAAPTSYPAVWLAPSLEFVQWNLTAADPLSRNIGQAQGVFGKTDLKGTTPSFATSANLVALRDDETWLGDLKPPRWPAALGPIDTARAEKGRDLFVANCADCHNAPPFEMTEAKDNLMGEAFIKVGATPLDEVGTDPLYNRALLGRWVETGPLAALFQGQKAVPAAIYFGGIVRTATVALLKQAGETDATIPQFMRMRPATHPDCGTTGQPCAYVPPGHGAALKAGPLLGIWATGPYLHNGSVRTVYELLSPPAERATSFWVGDRTLDPEHLGFADTETPGAFRFDTSVPGNGAQGHAFPKQALTPDERLAVIEYLKDPESFPVPRPATAAAMP